MLFTDVIGQDVVKQQLISDTQSGRVPHALMLAGKEGCGALELALAFAQYLLCSGKQIQNEGPSMFEDSSTPQHAALADHACGQCKSCHMATILQHPDLHLVFPIYKKYKAPKSTLCDDFLPEFREWVLQHPYEGFTEWRKASGAENQQLMIYESESDAIIRKLSLKASQNGYKICIIWLPEKMNNDCANKLLKLLEEPPAMTIFIMVSERPDLVLQTVRSRTQIIEMPALTENVIEQALIDRYSILPAEAKRIAHHANGSMTAALRSITESGDEKKYYDLFVSLMRRSYAKNVKEMKRWSEEIADMGRESQKQFLAYSQHMLRENFIYNFHHHEINYMNEAEAQFAVKFAPFINERNVIGMMEQFQLAYRDIEQNANPKILFFDLALKMIVLIKNR